jgi:hypothetical protein
VIQFAPEPGGRPTFDAFCRGLLTADWESASGPIRFCPNLTLSELADADFFINSRLFLTALAEGTGAPATATGNLNRTFVHSMFDRLKLPQSYRSSIRDVCKVVNEQDLWPLHLVRVVGECAGLVVRRKKSFLLTKLGRSLLPDDQAGSLYRRLFLAYFRRFDLHYDFHLRDAPGIQQTLAVTLWRLGTVAGDWTPVLGLAPKILLPGVHAQLRAAMTSPHDTEEWILCGYVLEPLSDFGLIEPEKRNERPCLADHDRIRLTSLWRKFVAFGYQPGGGN